MLVEEHPKKIPGTAIESCNPIISNCFVNNPIIHVKDA